MDRTSVSGTDDVGSIPTGPTTFLNVSGLLLNIKLFLEPSTDFDEEPKFDIGLQIRYHLFEMRKTLATIGIFCAVCASVNAASMMTEWTGAAGSSNLNDSGNWSNGVPARGSGNASGPDVIFNNVGSLVLSGNMVDSSDGGSITVKGSNSNVTISGSQYTGDINVGAGCQLSMGQLDFKNTQMHLDGIFNVSVCGVDGASTQDINIIFGTSGLFNVTQGVWSAGKFSISGLLDTTSASLPSSEFQFVTRTLVSCSQFYDGSMKLGNFTAADGSLLTKTTSAMSGNAADFAGQYYVDQDGAQIKVQYVVGGGYYPRANYSNTRPSWTRRIGNTPPTRLIHTPPDTIFSKRVPRLSGRDTLFLPMITAKTGI